MPKYSWGLVSFCLIEQCLCVLAQAFFFLKSSACSTSSADGSCPSVFHMHRGAAGRAGASWGCSRCLVPSAWRGELRGRCSLPEHGLLITAEEAPAGSVLIEQSSLRRGSIGLCCLLAQADPILLSCPLLLFCFGFFCLRVLYFFMSVLFTWDLGLVTITISTITLRSVFILLILQGFSSWTLSQLSNSFLNKAKPRSPRVASPV